MVKKKTNPTTLRRTRESHVRFHWCVSHQEHWDIMYRDEENNRTCERWRSNICCFVYPCLT